jgi:hypothetical protein
MIALLSVVVVAGAIAAADKAGDAPRTDESAEGDEYAKHKR